jgi:nucleoside-diphosphate-sugar epimerase
MPALSPAEDVWTNHIHAEDLARACWLALARGRPGRAINVVDQSELRMGDYFDQVADAFGLPRPPRLPRAELARQVSPMMLSFMSESRQIGNLRMRKELRLRLAFPTVASQLALLT